MVERQPSKLNVAGSNPVSRSIKFKSMLPGLNPEAFLFAANAISLKRIFLKGRELLQNWSFKEGLILKKFSIIFLIIVLMLVTSTWAAFAANNGGDAFEYFPLKPESFWSYKVTLPNNEVYSQIVFVNNQVGQDIRVLVLINQMPWMEVVYLLNEEGLFRVKQISPNGVVAVEPKQMMLASKLDPGISWNWESADKKERETVKVIGTEKVTVPVGTFEALIVQYEGVYPDGTAYIEKTWFVKGIGYVKAVNSRGDQAETKELIEYKTNL